MTRIILSTLFLFAISLNTFADTFKVKIQVGLVDHSSAAGTAVKVLERNQEVSLERLDSDGQVKFDLEKGKLYEIWIVKEGYIAHLINNVHSEGKGKFDVILYKNSDKVKVDESKRIGMARYIDDVEKMTIPAEYLAQGVEVVKKDELTKDQLVSMKVIEKLSKSQKKSQKKIDKLRSKKEGLEKKGINADADFVAGKMTDTEIEEYRLKNQKAIVKVQHAIDKLAY